MKQFEHGGNIHRALREGEPNTRYVDFSANINPLGPPEWLRPLISCCLSGVEHYPDPEYTDFREAVAKKHGVKATEVVVGNGTTELLYTFIRAHYASRVVIPVPSYVDYRRAAEIAGKEVIDFILLEKENFQLNCENLNQALQENDLVIIGNPNNPTGSLVNRERLLDLAKKNRETTFLVDEAFLDFAPSESNNSKSVAGTLPNIATINSMTKFYGVPGLRVGYGVFSEQFTELMKSIMAPWSVNTLAHKFAEKALVDTAYQEESRLLCQMLRNALLEELRQIPRITVFDSVANYFFLKINVKDADALFNTCKDEKLLIRKCSNYVGLQEPEKFVRIAVRTEEENKRLIEVFNSFFSTKEKKPKRTKKQQAKSVMFQGTCSDAGKSILTAGLCRVLLQDGVKVAPFKAQNMSLNSFVTLQGDEMGRAQVVQAQAAKLDPDCRMNPILLKPNSDTGSQIIVDGKPVGNMTVNTYNKYKKQAWESVTKSYDSLASEFNVVVLEGAGSPGEVNLKRNDIVNMKMAQYAKSPVILVGDIDRGGVYASFVGIMEVLAEWERNLVAGFLVNKFRGQASLLESAHQYVTSHTGKTVFGVLPYITNLGLPEEDSVSFKKGSFNTQATVEGIEIAVINLPHISNFTDIEPFLNEADVSIRIIDRVEQLQNPHAVILPGSKNVIRDLQFLKDNGFEQPLLTLHKNGVQIVGICGGYQMLGSKIKDPYQIESSLGNIDGLAMLDMVTVIEKEKNLTRKSGVHKPSGLNVVGYEIHHGISTANDHPLLMFDDNTVCGTTDHVGQVWGSYLHGIFDKDSFRRWFIDGLREKIGLEPLKQTSAPYNLEESFDNLAKTIREHISMDKIYDLMGL